MNMEKKRIPLKTNIGYLLNKPSGFARDAELQLDEVFIDPDLDVWDLDVKYRFSRVQEGILFQGQLSGRISAECVRCLCESTVSVTTPIEEIYFFPEKVREATDLVIPDDGYIDGRIFRGLPASGCAHKFVCSPIVKVSAPSAAKI